MFPTIDLHPLVTPPIIHDVPSPNVAPIHPTPSLTLNTPNQTLESSRKISKKAPTKCPYHSSYSQRVFTLSTKGQQLRHFHNNFVHYLSSQANNIIFVSKTLSSPKAF